MSKTRWKGVVRYSNIQQYEKIIEKEKRVKIMFENERYVTRGVNAEIPAWIQMVLWVMIDALEIQKDWLQVFRLTSETDTLKIIHVQEEPEYSQEVNLPLYGRSSVEAKIFVIDDGDHTTMLLAEEY